MEIWNDQCGKNVSGKISLNNLVQKLVLQFSEIFELTNLLETGRTI